MINESDIQAAFPQAYSGRCHACGAAEGEPDLETGGPVQLEHCAGPDGELSLWCTTCADEYVHVAADAEA